MPPDEELPELGNSEADRDTILSEMANLGKENDEQEPDDTADLSNEEPPAAAEAEEEASEDAETPQEEPEVTAKADEEAETDSALERIQQAEKRQKANVAEERAALAAEKAEWQAQQETAKAEREAEPPKTALQHLEDARRSHALYKAGQPNATVAEQQAAQRMAQETESSSQLKQALDEVKSLRDEIKADKEEAANKVQAKTFTDSIVAGITDAAPFAKMNLAGKGSAKTRDRLLNIAAYLHSKSGENPDPVDVFKIYEEAERADLMERGYDPDAVLKTATTKTKTPEATKTKSATLGNDLAISTPPRSEPLTEEEERADMLKGISALNK